MANTKGMIHLGDNDYIEKEVLQKAMREYFKKHPEEFMRICLELKQGKEVIHTELSCYSIGADVAMEAGK